MCQRCYFVFYADYDVPCAEHIAHLLVLQFNAELPTLMGLIAPLHVSRTASSVFCLCNMVTFGFSHLFFIIFTPPVCLLFLIIMKYTLMYIHFISCCQEKICAFLGCGL